MRAGIPVVSINSGSDVCRRLGILAHVGQPEERAGLEAGRRLAAAGVRHALCVNQEIGNQGARRALPRPGQGACARRGGRSRVLARRRPEPHRATPAQIADADRSGRHRRRARAELAQRRSRRSGVDARLGGRAGAVKIGTFDLDPDVLAACSDGRMLFAVDQQAYLQGYLPIVMLTERARYGLFPAQGDVLPTGPNFVTAATAGKAIELSKRSIR